MKVSLKASAPIAMLFGIAAAGQQVANVLQHIIGLGTATNLGFLTFLMGAIAAFKTSRYIQRRYP